jgi:O-antigen/teichoic acid export membrane protein
MGMKAPLERLLRKITFKNTAIYIVISFLQKAIGFFLLPLYTAVLAPTDYGIVNVVNTIVGFLSALYGLSLNGAAGRFYFRYKDDTDRLQKMWGSCLTFTLANTVVLSLVFGIFHGALIDPLAESVAFSPYIILGLISTGLSPVFVYFQTMLQVEQRGRSYGLNNLATFVLNLGLTLFFLLVLHWSAVGILAANAVTNLVFFVYSGLRILPRVRLGIDRKLLREALRYSLPLIPYNLSSFVALMIDRLFLNNIKGTAAVGIYSVGFQFANIMNVVTAAVLQAYSPWFYAQIEKGDIGKQAIRRNIGVIVSFFAFVGVTLVYVSPLLMRFMVNERFTESWTVIPPLAMGYVVYGIYLLTCNGLFASKTYYLPLATVFGAVLNVLLNLVIIPKLGMIGASISSLLYNLFITVFLVILVERVEHIGYGLSSLVVPILIIIPALSLTYAISPLALVPWMIASLFVVIFTSLGLYLVNRRQLRELFAAS